MDWVSPDLPYSTSVWSGFSHLFYISYEFPYLIFLYELYSRLRAMLLQDLAEFTLHLLFSFIWPFSFLFYSIVYVLICSEGKSFIRN